MSEIDSLKNELAMQRLAYAEARRLNADLLEALETVTGIAGRGDAFLEFPPTIEQWKVIVEKARTTIAKARGE